MRWPPFVDSLKLKVSFAEYILLYRTLLQKRLIILRSLLMVPTPYRAMCVSAIFFLNTPLPLDILEYLVAQDTGGVAGVARGDD